MNPDVAGWLSMPQISFSGPVVWCGNNTTYLDKAFDWTPSRNGCLFLAADAASDFSLPYQLIYGRNMHNGTMFGTLSDYADKEFWEDHQFVHYDTLYEEHLYQVVCAFRSYIHFVDEEGFRYYHFYGSSNEQEFNDYITNVKALQLYDTGVEVSYGDKLIALSTCDYYTDDGRFVVVAKLIR